ncbi:hypothetical protein HDU92_004884 [Lobulomyces angularis]|nr:hypothetical protein HDU92_004884 [Lobulomyces angularis]
MLLKTYFALLILLVVLEIGIGAAAYHKQEDLGVLIEDSWRNNAYANSSITESIKTLEISFKCCGLRNITDAPVPKNCASKFEWNTSCYDAVLGSMESSLDTIGATGLAMGLIELVAIVFSAVLFNRIAKKEKQGESLMTDSWRINRSKVQYGYQNYQYL